MSTKVVAFKESSSNILTPPEIDFRWTFRPLLIWMRIFGIPLSDIRSEKITKSGHFLILLIYALAVYIAEILVICSSIAGKVETTVSFNSKKNQSVASLVNGEVTYYNYMITIMLAHTGLLFVTSTKWHSFVSSLLRLERKRWFSSKDYQRFRRVFIIGSIVLLSVIRIYNECDYILILNSNNLQESALEMVLSWKLLAREDDHLKRIKMLVRILTHIYPYSGAILFCCCGRMAGLMLRQLNHRIEVEIRPGHLKILSDWKHCYASISQLVDRLSGCFGFHLLLLISSILIRMTANTFYSLLEVRDSGWELGNSITSLALVVKDQVYLVTFTLTAHKITQEVIYEFS